MFEKLFERFYAFYDARRKPVIDPVFYENALDILEKNGIVAHYYLPASNSRDNKELAEALNYFSGRGFIFTDKNNDIIGITAKARMSPDELANERRASFKLINRTNNG